jgi:tetratricopeptide (TPR) repeat protein
LSGQRRDTFRARRFVFVGVFLLAGEGQSLARADSSGLLDRFARHLREDAELEPRLSEEILTFLSGVEADADVEEVLVEALGLMSDEFRAGRDAYEGDDYEACLQATEALDQAPDLFVRYQARVYAIRALVQLDRFVEAQARLEAALEDVETLRRYSPAEAELHYLLGYCQVRNLEHEAGMETLTQFLEDYPDAPQRFIMTAERMLAELFGGESNPITEIVDLMDFSEKRLAHGDTGERVRAAQDQVIDLLDRLIRQTEQMERNQRSPSGQQAPRQQREQAPSRTPPTPRRDSSAPEGEVQEGLKRPGRRVRPGELWGSMPDAERERVLQFLEEEFPDRYRALIEQYYRELATQP